MSVYTISTSHCTTQSDLKSLVVCEPHSSCVEREKVSDIHDMIVYVSTEVVTKQIYGRSLYRKVDRLIELSYRGGELVGGLSYS